VVELVSFIAIIVWVWREIARIVKRFIVIVAVVSSILYRSTVRTIDRKVYYEADVLPIFHRSYQRGRWFKAWRLIAKAVVEAKRSIRQFGPWCLQLDHKIGFIERTHGTDSLQHFERHFQVERTHKISFVQHDFAIQLSKFQLLHERSFQVEGHCVRFVGEGETAVDVDRLSHGQSGQLRFVRLFSLEESSVDTERLIDSRSKKEHF